MSDEVDLANDNIIRDVEIARKLSGAFKSGISYVGYCFNCKEPLPSPKRWCGADCRDEYESERSGAYRRLR